MQTKLLAIFLFLLSSLQADVTFEGGWNVTKNSSPLSCTAEFEVKQGDSHLGTVVRKGLFTPRYFYDLYDANDAFQVRGITRVFSLGMLFAWGTEIDLYDDSDRWVGMIRGELWSNSRAKFAFYDAHSELTAHAFLNDETCDFLIVSASSKGDILATLKGMSYGDASNWELSLSTPFLPVDQRALQIFASFAADFQKSFIHPPVKAEIHYHLPNLAIQN